MRRLWAAGAVVAVVLATIGLPTLAEEVATTPASAGAVDEWPLTRTSCPEAAGEALRVVALGTSETAGWGIRADEPYSPQEAYPARYADLLCEELGRPVELHSYFPDQLRNTLAPLAWWNERLTGDESMREDLATADVVVIWTLSAHDVVPALLFGLCSGDWPDPLRGCLESATADIEQQMDAAFSTIGSLVPDGATVLAADGYLLPAIIDRWGARSYFGEIRHLADPHFVVERVAPGHGFTVVGSMAAINGPSLSERPADGIFQADGLHPTAAGAQLTAEAFAQQDGLGD